MNHFIERDNCPICESSELKTLYSLPYRDNILVEYLNAFYGSQGGVEFEYLENAEYCLDKCLSCNFIFQKYIPNDELMFKLYEEWIDPKIVFENQQSYKLKYYEKYAHEVINLISCFKKPSSELNFLDYGMGWGTWCLMAKAFGCNVFGTELSKTRIDHARELGIGIIDLNKSKNIKFDYINTDQVFEHLPEPSLTLELLKKSLKPNGVLKISVPNGNNFNFVLNKMNWKAPKGHNESLNMVAPLEHINCFSRETLVFFAKKHGLEPFELPASRRIFKSRRDFLKKQFKSIKDKLFGFETHSTNVYFRLKTQTSNE